MTVKTPDLPHGEMHVWRVSLAGKPYLASKPLLPADERERAGRFRFDEHRAEWAASRAALRSLLARYIDQAPMEIEFAIAANGKPSLARVPKVEFNLSHTSGLALIAVTRANPCGIDVERMRDDLEPLVTAPAVFAPDEIALIARRPPGEQTRAFLQTWTRKEAWLKMLGSGLVDDLPDYSLTDPARLPEALRPGTLMEIDAGADYLAAVAARDAVDRVEVYIW